MSARRTPFVFEVDHTRPEGWEAALEAGAGALDHGGLVVLPTETVYGLAARPDRASGTARGFEALPEPSVATTL